MYPVCPSIVAWCKGPLPLESAWFTLAPFCSRNSHAAREFCRDTDTSMSPVPYNLNKLRCVHAHVCMLNSTKQSTLHHALSHWSNVSDSSCYTTLAQPTLCSFYSAYNTDTTNCRTRYMHILINTCSHVHAHSPRLRPV